MNRAPALDGHSAVLHAPSGVIIVYGGRVSPTQLNPFLYGLYHNNATQWGALLATGEVPVPRCLHTAVMWTSMSSTFMIVFGGALCITAYDRHWRDFNLFAFPDAFVGIDAVAGQQRRDAAKHECFATQDDMYLSSLQSHTSVAKLQSCTSHLFALEIGAEADGFPLRWEEPWTTGGDVPETRMAHSATMFRGDTMLIYGGYSVLPGDQRRHDLMCVSALHLPTKMWRRYRADIFPCAFGATMFERDLVLFLHGGVNTLLGKEDNTLYAADAIDLVVGPAEKHLEWSVYDKATDSVPTARSFAASLALCPELVYTFGGCCDVASTVLSDLWVLSLDTGDFYYLGEAPEARCGHTMTATSDGEVLLVVGGRNEAGDRTSRVLACRCVPGEAAEWLDIPATFNGVCKNLASVAAQRHNGLGNMFLEDRVRRELYKDDPSRFSGNRNGTRQRMKTSTAETGTSPPREQQQQGDTNVMWSDKPYYRYNPTQDTPVRSVFTYRPRDAPPPRREESAEKGPASVEEVREAHDAFYDALNEAEDYTRSPQRAGSITPRENAHAPSSRDVQYTADAVHYQLKQRVLELKRFSTGAARSSPPVCVDDNTYIQQRCHDRLVEDTVASVGEVTTLPSSVLEGDPRIPAVTAARPDMLKTTLCRREPYRTRSSQWLDANHVRGVKLAYSDARMPSSYVGGTAPPPLNRWKGNDLADLDADSSVANSAMAELMVRTLHEAHGFHRAKQPISTTTTTIAGGGGTGGVQRQTSQRRPTEHNYQPMFDTKEY